MNDGFLDCGCTQSNPCQKHTPVTTKPTLAEQFVATAPPDSREAATPFMEGLQIGSLTIQPNLFVRLVTTPEWMKANPDKDVVDAPIEAHTMEIALTLLAVDQGALSARSTVYGLKKICSVPLGQLLVDLNKALGEGTVTVPAGDPADKLVRG